jgi:hypothetical protein
MHVHGCARSVTAYHSGTRPALETITEDQGENMAVADTKRRCFTGQDRKALLGSIVLCREACVRVLIEAPIGEPAYLAAQKLITAIDKAVREVKAR